jgi:hypothetical protein
MLVCRMPCLSINPKQGSYSVLCLSFKFQWNSISVLLGGNSTESAITLQTLLQIGVLTVLTKAKPSLTIEVLRTEIWFWL